MIWLSLVVGLLMVVLFGYTSDQKAIGIAKDQLKAHLLAVRLYRDQIPVVMGSYGKILRGTGRYLNSCIQAAALRHHSDYVFDRAG